ncbi:MAG: hypothetical protein HY821_08465 [Acidobacteria bacterium]|nr:hypothetical protein [Acidobacteriota bacterium]
MPALRAPELAGFQHIPRDYAGKVTQILFWNPANLRAASAVHPAAAMALTNVRAALVTVVSEPAGPQSIAATLETAASQPAVLLDRDRRVFAGCHIVALPALQVSEDRIFRFKADGSGRKDAGQTEEALDELCGWPKPAPVTGSRMSSAPVHQYAVAQESLKLGLTAQPDSARTSVASSHAGFRLAWVALAYRHTASSRVDAPRQCFEQPIALDADQPGVAPGMAWQSWKHGKASEIRSWPERFPPSDPNRFLLEEIRP